MSTLFLSVYLIGALLAYLTVRKLDGKSVTYNWENFILRFVCLAFSWATLVVIGFVSLLNLALDARWAARPVPTWLKWF
jgi:uncharacterized membrane protein